MGFTINIKTNQQILVKANATDGSVSKSIPVKNTDTFNTYVFPDNVLTLTTLFIKEFFNKELSNCTSLEEFNSKYVIKLTYGDCARAQEVINGIIRNYYLTKK